MTDGRCRRRKDRTSSPSVTAFSIDVDIDFVISNIESGAPTVRGSGRIYRRPSTDPAASRNEHPNNETLEYDIIATATHGQVSSIDEERSPGISSPVRNAQKSSHLVALRSPQEPKDASTSAHDVNAAENNEQKSASSEVLAETRENNATDNENHQMKRVPSHLVSARVPQEPEDASIYILDVNAADNENNKQTSASPEVLAEIRGDNATGNKNHQMTRVSSHLVSSRSPQEPKDASIYILDVNSADNENNQQTSASPEVLAAIREKDVIDNDHQRKRVLADSQSNSAQVTDGKKKTIEHNVLEPAAQDQVSSIGKERSPGISSTVRNAQRSSHLVSPRSPQGPKDASTSVLVVEAADNENNQQTSASPEVLAEIREKDVIDNDHQTKRVLADSQSKSAQVIDRKKKSLPRFPILLLREELYSRSMTFGEMLTKGQRRSKVPPKAEYIVMSDGTPQDFSSRVGMEKNRGNRGKSPHSTSSSTSSRPESDNYEEFIERRRGQNQMVKSRKTSSSRSSGGSDAQSPISSRSMVDITTANEQKKEQMSGGYIYGIPRFCEELAALTKIKIAFVQSGEEQKHRLLKCQEAIYIMYDCLSDAYVTLHFDGWKVQVYDGKERKRVDDVLSVDYFDGTRGLRNRIRSLFDWDVIVHLVVHTNTKEDGERSGYSCLAMALDIAHGINPATTTYDDKTLDKLCHLLNPVTEDPDWRDLFVRWNKRPRVLSNPVSGGVEKKLTEVEPLNESDALVEFCIQLQRVARTDFGINVRMAYVGTHDVLKDPPKRNEKLMLVLADHRCDPARCAIPPFFIVLFYDRDKGLFLYDTKQRNDLNDPTKRHFLKGMMTPSVEAHIRHLLPFLENEDIRGTIRMHDGYVKTSHDSVYSCMGIMLDLTNTHNPARFKYNYMELRSMMLRLLYQPSWKRYDFYADEYFFALEVKHTRRHTFVIRARNYARSSDGEEGTSESEQ